MSKPIGMKYDLGDYLMSTYGPAGTIIGYLDQPSYIVRDDDGTQHTIAVSAIGYAIKPRPLPTTPGTIILWDDGAYCKHIAELASDLKLGWRTDSSVKESGSGNEQVWATADEVLAAIGRHGYTILVPESASVVGSSPEGQKDA